MKSGIILFFTLFLLSVNFASAQGAGSTGELEEIIVTAERRAESIQSVSVAVSAIDSAAIESKSIDNLLDVGRHVPNTVIVNGTGPANSSRIFIRGMGEDDSRNPDPAVATYLDGVFLGRTIGGLLDAVDIGQIEVLRGPQGTMFGRNSNGGAVRVFSVGPQDEDSMSLTAGLGSDGRKMAKAVLNFQVSDDTAVRIAGMQKERDAFVTLKPNGDLSGNARDAGEIDINVLRASLRTNFNDDWTGTFTVDQVNDKSEPMPASIIPFNNSSDPSVVTDVDQDIYTSEPAPGATCSSFVPAGFLPIGCFTGYRSDIEIFGASARIEGKIGELDFMSLTAHRALEDDQNMFVQLPYHQMTDQEQLSQEFTISSNYDGAFNFVAGMYYWEEEVDFYMDFAFLHTSLTETESLALFAQGSFALSDTLTVVGGIRHTDETRDFAAQNVVFGVARGDSIDMTNETYTAKLEYQPSDDLFMYLSLSTGFKTPGFSPDCFPPFIACFSSVSEEEVTSFEAGLRSDLMDGHMRFNATAFYSEYDDIQMGATVPGLGFTRFNLNSATVQGLEVDMVFKSSDNFEVFANLGLLDGEYENLTEQQIRTITVDGATCPGGVATRDCAEGKQMKNAPEFQANLGFLWTANVGSGEISFGGDVAIEDESYALVANNPGALIDPDPIVNARISYAPNGGNWNIALWGKNLTDEEYWKATTSPNVAYPIAPLTWGVDIRADF